MGLKLRKIKPEESEFGPSFDGKYGPTDFYQIYEGDQVYGELEVKNDSDGVEIMSVYTNSNSRGKGVGKFAVDQVFKIYKTDDIKMLTTAGSRPFWKHVGAIPIGKSKDMYHLPKSAFYKQKMPVVVSESTFKYKKGSYITEYKKVKNGILVENKNFISNKNLIFLKENLSVQDEKRVKDLIKAQLKYFFWQLYTKNSFMLGNI